MKSDKKQNLKASKIVAILALILAMLGFVAIISIGIFGLFGIMQDQKIIEEFCNDRGYDHSYEGDGRNCYRVQNDEIVWKRVSIINGKPYFGK